MGARSVSPTPSSTARIAVVSLRSLAPCRGTGIGQSVPGNPSRAVGDRCVLSLLPMAFCSDCLHELGPEETGRPSPACGGSNVSVRGGLATEMDMAHPGALRVTRADHQPWSEKWARAQRRLERVRGMYAGHGEPGNAALEDELSALFDDCNHLREWLKKDSANLPFTEDDVDEWFWEDEHLKICNAISNSDKHHTRSGTQMTARIRDTTAGAAGAKVEIEVHWATPDAYAIDGLALAESVVGAFRGFLSQHGIEK